MPLRDRHLLHQQAATMLSVCNLRPRQAIRAGKLEHLDGSASSNEPITRRCRALSDEIAFRAGGNDLESNRQFLFISIDATNRDAHDACK